jgi:hypothetical protein
VECSRLQHVRTSKNEIPSPLHATQDYYILVDCQNTILGIKKLAYTAELLLEIQQLSSTNK